MWKKIEKWGKDNPISSALMIVFFTMMVTAIPSGFSGYNLGFYAGSTTAESQWRALFDIRVKDTVSQQIAGKCGDMISEVNNSCNQSIRTFESSLRSKEEYAKSLENKLSFLTERSDILDLHDNLISNANSILSSILAAREKRDQNAEQAARDRTLNLLHDINKLNNIYSDWAALFDSIATQLANRSRSGETISTDELIAFVNSFVSDNDRKRRVIQSEIEVANKIKRSKY